MSSIESELVESGEALEAFAASYENEAFDEYSDSFESSGGEEGVANANGDRAAAAAEPETSFASHSRGASGGEFEIGERVQVFWADEREWFAGRAARVDALSGRCFVQYDDGEEAWENAARMRYAPAAFAFDATGFQQLQLLLLSSTQHDDDTAALLCLRGAKALVYWRESSSWFAGSVVHADVEARALQIEYDDGDLRWEQECDFTNILVLPAPTSYTESHAASAKPHASDSHPLIAEAAAVKNGDAEAEAERVVVPRAYKAVLSNHFQPERTPRPYVSVANTIGSVLTPRAGRYSERRYLHSAKLECTVCEESPRTAGATEEILSRDCLVQTDIDAAPNVDNADHQRRVHYSQCC